MVFQGPNGFRLSGVKKASDSGAVEVDVPMPSALRERYFESIEALVTAFRSLV